MSSDIYFNVASWFPGNVRVKPHFTIQWGSLKSLKCAYVIHEWSPRSSNWIHYCLDDKVHSYQRFSITRNLTILSYELQQLFVGWDMRNVWHSFYPFLWNISGTCVLTKWEFSYYVHIVSNSMKIQIIGGKVYLR